MNPRKLLTAEQTLEKEMCRRDAHYFIFGGHLLTKDEHDIQHPIKPFPDQLYLRSLLECLLISGHLLNARATRFSHEAGHSLAFLETLASSGILMVEKSRQVMATWLTCAYLLWRAKFKPHQLLLVQSKKEEDAANLVFVKEPWQARISFMESHLPKFLQTVTFPRGGAYAHLWFPNGSHIWGIPEGGDVVRSNTASVIFADEAAFQPEFASSFTAALPAIKGGGSFVAVSSAEPGTFAELVEAA